MTKGAKIGIGIGSAVVGLVVLYFVLKHFGVIGKEGKSGATGFAPRRRSYTCECPKGSNAWYTSYTTCDKFCPESN